MTHEEASKHVLALTVLACEALTSLEALQFSQAACNIANALCSLTEAKNQQE